MIPWVEDDGGRAAAGYRGRTSDCVPRAIAIATGKPYSEVYDELFEASREHGRTRRDKEARSIQRRGGSPRDGVHKKVYAAYLAALGWEWVPTMAIGQGCTVHLRADELPGGTIICRLSGHIATVIDGVLHDTDDCSRDGTGCVYGYWQRP